MDSSSNADNRKDIASSSAILNIRRRFGQGNDLWVAAEVGQDYSAQTNPELQEYPQNITGYYRYRDGWGSLKLRSDLLLDPRPDTTTNLIMGVAGKLVNVNEHFDFLVSPPVDTSGEYSNNALAYLQLSRHLTEHLTITGQLDWINHWDRYCAYGSDQVTDNNYSIIHSSVIATYQPTANTTLRGIYFKKPGLYLNANLPMDTMLLIENGILPRGGLYQDGHADIYEFDAERYFPHELSTKLFLFSYNAYTSASDNAAFYIQAPGISQAPPTITLNRLRYKGAGCRVSKRLASHLTTNALLIVSSSRCNAPGKVYDGYAAPYQPTCSGLFSLNYLSPHGLALGISLQPVGRLLRRYAARDLRAAPTLPRRSIYVVDICPEDVGTVADLSQLQ